MPSGVAPDLPESGWKVHYTDALTRWLETDPGLSAIEPVVRWLEACKASGPPTEGVTVDGDWYVARVPGTSLYAAFVVVEYEFLIIVKQFR